MSLITRQIIRKFKKKVGSKKVRVQPRFYNFYHNWDFYEYFLLGGYGSGKSFTVALKLVVKATQEKRNILVIRQVHNTHRDSTYADIKEAIELCEYERFFKVTKSPLEATCIKTGSRVIFRGLDDWRKLKSIKNISIVFIEEGEGSMEAYKELKDRMRATGAKPVIIVATNPQPKRHWVYKRFIEELGVNEEELYEKKELVVGDVYLHHSTYKDNLENLSPRWVKNLEAETDPTMIKIKREGKFGSSGVKVLSNVSQADTRWVYEQVVSLPKSAHYHGLDWGFKVSYNALVSMAVDDRDENNKILYIYREYYKRDLTNAEIMNDVDDYQRSGDLIIADSAEPKSIRAFQMAGFNMIGCKKFPGSVAHNIKKLKGFHKIIVSEDCVNTWEELDDLTHAVDQYGDIIEDEFNIDAHTKDAIVYGLDKYEHSDQKDYRGELNEYVSRGRL